MGAWAEGGGVGDLRWGMSGGSDWNEALTWEVWWTSSLLDGSVLDLEEKPWKYRIVCREGDVILLCEYSTAWWLEELIFPFRAYELDKSLTWKELAAYRIPHTPENLLTIPFFPSTTLSGRSKNARWSLCSISPLCFSEQYGKCAHEY